MKKIKILSNQNKLCSEITSQALYQKEVGDFSIRMVLAGSEEYSLGNKVLNIFPGYFLVLNEGTCYKRSIFTDTPASTFSVLFTKNFLQSFHSTATLTDDQLLDRPFDFSNGCPVFPETIYPFKNDMKFNLMHLKNHFDAGVTDELLLNEYLYHSLMLFYEVYKKEHLINPNRLNFVKQCTKSEIFKRLNNVKDYMISNYNRSISIEELSQYACLSECHLYKLFKELYHCSPHQYLLQVRLNRAKHLLHQTKYSIDEIVGMVGFENSSSFIRLFKRNYAATPKDYRFSRFN